MIENEYILKEKVIENLKNVYDPEIPANVYDFGLIYEIDFEEREIGVYCTIMMTLTSPACPVAQTLVEMIKYAGLAVDGIDEVKVHITFRPAWNKSMMTDDAREIMELSGSVI